MVDMEIVDMNEDSIMVSTVRTIRIGQTIRINPSEAFLGIDSGLIAVSHILEKADMQSVDSPDHELADIVLQIESDKDVYLQGAEGTDEYAGRLSDLDNQPWVVYEYKYGRNVGDWYVLPLDLFVAHTMMY